jgi:hypothetical protein
VGQRHRLLLPDRPTPRRLTPPTSPCPPRHPRPDPRNLATRKSWYRPADHACATAPYPAAVQGNHVNDHTKSPIHGFRLSLSKIRSALKQAGRQRNIDSRAQQIRAALRTEQFTAPAAVATTSHAAVGIITELNREIADLEAELATHFETHSDADVYLSCQDSVSCSAPGCSVNSGTT